MLFRSSWIQKPSNKSTQLNFLFSMHRLQNCKAISNVPCFGVCQFLYLLGTCSKSKRVSNLTSVVPSIQHFFFWVVVHHVADAGDPFVLHVGVPLFACFCVVSKVDDSGLGATGIDTVDHSTNYKGIGYRGHCFCAKICNLELSWIQCFTWLNKLSHLACELWMTSWLLPSLSCCISYF